MLEVILPPMTSHVQTDTVFVSCIIDLKDNIEGDVVVLGGLPVHTEYRCLFLLRYEFLIYRKTGVCRFNRNAALRDTVSPLIYNTRLRRITAATRFYSVLHVVRQNRPGAYI